jgi:hypothetical protein
MRFIFPILLISINIHSQSFCRSILTLPTINKTNLTVSPPVDHIAILFLNDECPICRYYASDIENLDTYCSSRKIKLYLSFSGDYSKKKIKSFLKKYKIKATCILDRETNLAKLVNAQLTPEIFLYHCTDDKILYKGAIDDTYVSLGKRKVRAEKNYFKDAIDAQRNNTPYISNTEAVGCMIEIK